MYLYDGYSAVVFIAEPYLFGYMGYIAAQMLWFHKWLLSVWVQ